MLRNRFVQLSALIGLTLPGSALAMSCDEIMGMLDYNVPASVVIDTMVSSGGAMTSEDVACLQRKGAPATVVEKARSLAAASAPPPAMDEPAEAPRSRFDEAESLGSGDLEDLNDAPPVDESVIDRYRADIKAKKYLSASQGLFELLQDNAFPQKDTVIKYYLAKSLEGLGTLQGAQHYYMEVVKKGPRNPLFKYALPRVAAIANYTGNDYELRRIVGKIRPEEYPRGDRAQLEYLMGRKSYEDGKLSEAAAHFSQVPDGHELFPRARYFEGVINFEREKLKSSVRAYQEVIKAKVPVDDPRLVRELEDLKDLSLVNIARIYFGLQRMDDAERYYNMVERSSSYWPTALFERAWTSFYQQDLNESLGLLLTVDSPYFTEVEFIPEIEYLKALSYFSYCEYSEVERLLTIFESEYRPVRNELRAFIDQYRTAEGRKLSDQAFDAYFGAQAGESAIPAAMFTRILRQRDLAAMIRHMDMMNEDLALIDEQKAAWRNSVGKDLENQIRRDMQNYKRKAGQYLLQAMLQQYRTVDGLLKDADVLRFEVVDAQRVDYEYQLANPEPDSLNESPIDFATQTDVIYWPFNGEFWRDELGYYRYTEQGACK